MKAVPPTLIVRARKKRNATSEVWSDGHMTIKRAVRGAAPEQTARGLRAAFLVLNAAGVTDIQAALAHHEIEGWTWPMTWTPKKAERESFSRS